MSSDLDRIREALEYLPHADGSHYEGQCAFSDGCDKCQLLALLDGAVGLTRPGDVEAIARRFHETYERLASSFGYETRPESAVPWEQVPERNRALMVATVREVLASGRPGEEQA